MSELKAIRGEEIYNIIEYEDCYRTDDLYYPKSEADKVIAELEESHKKEVEQLLMEIVELKAKLGAVNELVKESRELLKESQKMHQRCADGASKQIRRLKRALYKACANWALSTLAWLDCIDQGEPRKWSEMQQKCLKKVEEFK